MPVLFVYLFYNLGYSPKPTIMKRIPLLILAVLIPAGFCISQENLTYQKPSKEILDLIDVPPTPSVMMDDKNEIMVLTYRDAFISIAELSRTEMRLAGLRNCHRRLLLPICRGRRIKRK